MINFLPGIYWIRLFSAALLMLGFLIVALTSHLYFRGHEVSIEVVSLGTQQAENDPLYSPLFRIIDGEHQDLRYRLPYSIGFVEFQSGEILSGWYDPLTNRILPSSLIRLELLVSGVLIGMGLFFACFRLWGPLANDTVLAISARFRR